jgi:hypothetical protein
MAVNFGQLILYADHFRPEKPGAANQMRKEQCWIYAGVDSNRGGGSPVRQAPDIASGMGWKKDGFCTIPENTTRETVEPRATSLGMSEPLHASGGQQSAPTSVSLHESALQARAT